MTKYNEKTIKKISLDCYPYKTYQMLSLSLDVDNYINILSPTGASIEKYNDSYNEISIPNVTQFINKYNKFNTKVLFLQYDFFRDEKLLSIIKIIMNLLGSYLSNIRKIIFSDNTISNKLWHPLHPNHNVESIRNLLLDVSNNKSLQSIYNIKDLSARTTCVKFINHIKNFEQLKQIHLSLFVIDSTLNNKLFRKLFRNQNLEKLSLYFKPEDKNNIIKIGNKLKNLIISCERTNDINIINKNGSSSLEYIKLSKCGLKLKLLKFIKRHKQLKTLILNGSMDQSDFNIETLINIKSITKLSLSEICFDKGRENNIIIHDDETDKFIYAPTRLTSLCKHVLNSNILTELSLTLCYITTLKFRKDKLTNLRKLDLSNNQITNLKNLHYLTQLTDLNLSHNKIKEIKSLNLHKLTNLEILNLEANKLYKFKVKHISYSISNINIKQNNITNVKDITFDKFPNVKNFEIDDNLIVTNIKHLNKYITISTSNLYLLIKSIKGRYSRYINISDSTNYVIQLKDPSPILRIRDTSCENSYQRKFKCMNAKNRFYLRYIYNFNKERFDQIRDYYTRFYNGYIYDRDLTRKTLDVYIGKYDYNDPWRLTNIIHRYQEHVYYYYKSKNIYLDYSQKMTKFIDTFVGPQNSDDCYDIQSVDRFDEQDYD